MRAGHQRRRMAPQHLARTDVARVARVARHGVARVAERVVVVGDGDDAGTAMDERSAGATRAASAVDDLFEQALHRVHAFSGIGEVAHFQGARRPRRGSGFEPDTTSSSRHSRRGTNPRAGGAVRSRASVRACPSAPSQGPGAGKSLRAAECHGSDGSRRRVTRAAGSSSSASSGRSARHPCRRSDRDRARRGTRSPGPPALGELAVDDLRHALLQLRLRVVGLLLRDLPRVLRLVDAGIARGDHRVDDLVEVDALVLRNVGDGLAAAQLGDQLLGVISSAFATASRSMPAAPFPTAPRPRSCVRSGLFTKSSMRCRSAAAIALMTVSISTFCCFAMSAIVVLPSLSFWSSSRSSG